MTELDRLLVRIEADAAPLDAALQRVGESARAAGAAVSEGLATAPREELGALSRELQATDQAARATGVGLSAALEQGSASALALADSIGRVLGQALDGSIGSWEALRRVALSTLDDILRALLKASGASRGGGGIFGDLFEGLGGLGIPGLSAGGRVEPGRLYEVGEGGRELFVPSLPGTVVPSLASDRLLARMGGGTGGPIQVRNTYNIDARGAQEGVGAEIAAALDARSARIKAETVDQVFALMDRGGRYAKASGRR